MGIFLVLPRYATKRTRCMQKNGGWGGSGEPKAVSEWGHERGRQTDRQNMEETGRREARERNKRGKRSKRLESELCLVAALKGCTCHTADGGKAPGDRWWCTDGATALEAEAGCCRGGDEHYHSLHNPDPLSSMANCTPFQFKISEHQMCLLSRFIKYSNVLTFVICMFLCDYVHVHM